MGRGNVIDCSVVTRNSAGSRMCVRFNGWIVVALWLVKQTHVSKRSTDVLKRFNKSAEIVQFYLAI